VCANIGEAYRKRQYKAYFISKLSDSDMENTETQIWLSFALKCNYINTEEYEDLIRKSFEIGRIVSYMIKFPSKFLPAKRK
jgi:four helix bundle protein